MKRRGAAIFVALLGVVMAVFFLAPIVYSPITVFGGAVGCVPPKGCQYAAYESPSCAVFGIGTENNIYHVWSLKSYQFGCPPESVFDK